MVFAGLQNKPAQERGGVRGKVNLRTFGHCSGFSFAIGNFRKVLKGLAGRSCFQGMRHERPSFEVLGQEESKSVLLPLVLFLE